MTIETGTRPYTPLTLPVLALTPDYCLRPRQVLLLYLTRINYNKRTVSLFQIIQVVGLYRYATSDYIIIIFIRTPG